MNFDDLMTECHGDKDSHTCHQYALLRVEPNQGALEEDHPSEGAVHIDELSLSLSV